MARSKFKPFGYSLVETVLYVGILAIIVVLVVGAILSAYRIFTISRIERRIATNGDIVLETLIRDIRNATSTDTAASTFGVSPGVLKIDEKTFSISGNSLQVQKGANPPENITGSDVKVTNLIFYHNAATTTDSEILKIEMTLESGSNNFLRAKNFFGSAVLRRTY